MNTRGHVGRQMITRPHRVEIFVDTPQYLVLASGRVR